MENSIKNQIKELIKNSHHDNFNLEKDLCDFLEKHQFNVVGKDKFKDFLNALYFLNIFHQNNYSQLLFAIIEKDNECFLVSYTEKIGTFDIEVYPFEKILQAIEDRQSVLNFVKNFLKN